MWSSTPLIAWSPPLWVIAMTISVLGAGAIAGVILCRRRYRWAARMTDHPLSKYVTLSLVAHLVLGFWAYFSNWLTPPPTLGPPSVVTVELDGNPAPPVSEAPWDTPPATETPLPEAPPLEATEPAPAEERAKPNDVVQTQDPLPAAPTPAPEPTSRWADPPSTKLPEPQVVATRDDSPNAEAEKTETTAQQTPASREQPATPIAATPVEPPALADTPMPTTEPKAVLGGRLEPIPKPDGVPGRPLQKVSSRWGTASAGQLPVRRTQTPKRATGGAIPNIYRDRFAPNRLALLQARGGSADTEAAVRAALAWLSQVQAEDGRWEAQRFGGGQAAGVGGHDRQGAGAQADTGVTGLAVLTFLGAGHTHLEGKYADVIRRGLAYLQRTQDKRSDGSLAGSAGPFAAMYCHGIGMLALSEAFAITGDPALRRSVERAVAFSLAAQHPVTGGWRYRPYEQGDTSQLGWQLMGLTSAHYSGISIPQTAWTGAGRFLNSVAWGSHGGLSAYRPGERPSAAMTAEALMCRLMLGLPLQHPLVGEASDYLVQRTPSESTINYYYWYYGTLALYPLQDARWDTWNSSVKKVLLSRQRTTGSQTGSWDPDSVWGGAGGRVYSTAVAALSLEVYYRYRPPPSGARRPERTAWNRR